LNLGGAATAINMGVTNGLTTITGNARITQNLTVVGTTTTTESETVLINDNHLYLNNAYTTAVAQTGGLVVNYLPTATTTTVAAGGFATTSTIATTGAATFAAGDIIQVSGATNPANNGIYEVLTHAANVLTIDTTPTEDFLQNILVVSVGAVGVLTKVTVSVMRSGTDGLWEVAAGATTPFTFADLATSSASGWTDDGTVVRLTTASDNVGIGTAAPGTNKLNITNDTTGDRNLLLVEVAAQTAAPFRIETSAAVLEFEVAVGGATTMAGDAAVNGGDITTTQTTATLFNATATTLSVGGAATTLNMGAATGTLTIGNPTITGTNATSLNLNGASPAITTTSTTASVFNATVTTGNLFGAGTTVSIGAATGTTTINNANTVVTGDLAVNGGDMTSSATTFNLLNATVTTLNLGGAATTANLVTAATTLALGGSSGTLTIGNTTITGTNATSLNLNGASPAITTTSTTGSLFNATVTTGNLFGAGTTITIGATTGTTTVRNSLAVNGNTTLGDASADTISATGQFNTSLIPSVTLTNDLGSSTLLWNNLFVGSLVSNATGATYVAGAAGVTASRVVYKDAVTASAVLNASNAALSTSNTIVGVARTTAASTASVVVDYAGVVTMDAATGITIAIGDVLFLDVGGEVTNVAPTTSGTVAVVVGYAKTASASGGTFSAQFQPRAPYVNP
jgi:hypothetical protein